MLLRVVFGLPRHATTSQAAYNQALRAYLEQRRSQLSPMSVERLDRGSVLRVLDSKEAADAPIIASAPRLSEFLSPESTKVGRAGAGELSVICGGGCDLGVGWFWGLAGLQRFIAVQRGLDALTIPFTLDETLVRGLVRSSVGRCSCVCVVWCWTCWTGPSCCNALGGIV